MDWRGVKLGVEPTGKAVEVIQVRGCSGMEGSKGRYLRIKRQDFGSVLV